MSNKLTNNKTI